MIQKLVRPKRQKLKETTRQCTGLSKNSKVNKSRDSNNDDKWKIC